MRNLSILIFLAGLLSQSAQHTVDPDVLQLAKVTLFAFGGVGFAGTTTPGEKGYAAIMSLPMREELLEKVFETGTPEAKSYALVGIKRLDNARFKMLTAELRSSKLEVHTAAGCILGRSSLGSIIQRIDAGEYALYR